jgi:hypothetical protein
MTTGYNRRDFYLNIVYYFWNNLPASTGVHRNFKVDITRSITQFRMVKSGTSESIVAEFMLDS